MTKQEFLEKLRMALGGKLSAEQVQDNINFYEDYINTEIRKGKSEEEVLGMLGDPRLIAKTIVETADVREENAEEYSENGGSYRYNGEVRRDDEHNRQVRNLSKVPAWLWLVLVLIIIVVILSAVFSVISALLPVLLPILTILFLVKIFRDWIN